MASAISPCIFCQIARSSNSTPDDKVVTFQDIKPAAFRHFLVIPVEHIPTVKDLRRGNGHYTLKMHLSQINTDLVFISLHSIVLTVDHLHLHCFVLPFIPSWKQLKYLSLGPLGFIKAEKLLEKLKPLSSIPP